jgi:NADH-quinone oxidoreductase subunit G
MERVQHRGKPISITIDGVNCSGRYGQTILEIARENRIYIPTMCYLTKVAPISSCRMCVVEVDGVDGFVLSCQEKAVDGATISTNSTELFKHRQNIMKLYNVNHPLECGVCDKSGECHLQNKSLEFAVSNQNFMAKEQQRDIKSWGVISYDPYLCIMCEKCVHVCNEVIGDDAIKISVGGYNSIITPTSEDGVLDCSNCGECTAVCPVGALVSSDFKYSSNAWELKSIPATCTHCSSGCHLYYDVKNDGIHNSCDFSIKRVKNDFEFATLCTKGRYGFDFENRDVVKDEASFNKAVESFKKAKTIKFNSTITNEEALILQNLKEKYGYSLVNSDAFRLKEFLDAFASTSNKSLYSATLKDIEKSDLIISIGSKVINDNQMVKYSMNIAQKSNRAKVVYMHPIEDSDFSHIATQFVKYEVGSEEGVVAMLLDAILSSNESIDSTVKDYIDSLDMGYISAESNVGEEEIDEVKKALIKSKNLSLVIGDDVLSHKNRVNIAKMVGLIEKYSDFKVLVVPNQINSLGVALICDLDEKEQGSSIGYNTYGDFTIASYGSCDLDMPVLTQQEGTFTNINKRVVPTNVALPYSGYTLNDLANSLGLSSEYTINYTSKLPTQKGFKSLCFDSLDNEYSFDGDEKRGYLLDIQELNSNSVSIEPISDISEYNGVVIYNCNPISQSNEFTKDTKQLQCEPTLLGSSQFAQVAKIYDGDIVEFNLNGLVLRRVFKIDTKLKGTIALNPTFDKVLSDDLISLNYRYAQIKIERVVNN